MNCTSQIGYIGAEQSQPALELSKLGRNIALRAGQNFRMFQLAKQKLGGCATKDRDGQKVQVAFLRESSCATESFCQLAGLRVSLFSS